MKLNLFSEPIHLKHAMVNWPESYRLTGLCWKRHGLPHIQGEVIRKGSPTHLRVNDTLICLWKNNPTYILVGGFFVHYRVHIR